jgi:hypothetical protein
LADYLANDASAAIQAQELQDMVHLASQVVRQPAPAIEPPNQIHRLLWRHRAERVLALAASFVIGVSITALALRANLRHEDNSVSLAPSVQNASTPSPRLDAVVKRKIESLPFWSNQRLYLLASAATADADAKETVK